MDLGNTIELNGQTYRRVGASDEGTRRQLLDIKNRLAALQALVDDLIGDNLRDGEPIAARPAPSQPTAVAVPSGRRVQVTPDHDLLERYLADPTATLESLGNERGVSYTRIHAILKRTAVAEGRTVALRTRAYAARVAVGRRLAALRNQHVA